jgi:hypothetical protein
LRAEKLALEDHFAALDVEVARKVDAVGGDLEVRVRAQERERAQLEKAELRKRLDDMTAQ